MKPVELLPSALAELEGAAEWYESRRAGLGSELLDTVQSVLRDIGEQPNRFPKWDDDERYRKVKVPRFPYIVFYLEHGDVVSIVAVAHGRRNPGYWKKRNK